MKIETLDVRTAVLYKMTRTVSIKLQIVLSSLDVYYLEYFDVYRVFLPSIFNIKISQTQTFYW